MTTYVYGLLPIYSEIPFDPIVDLLDFSGSGISAAELVPWRDDNEDEVSFFTEQRFIRLLFEHVNGPLRLSSSNFRFSDGSVVLIGDDSVAWRDDSVGHVLNGSSR